MRAQFQFLGTGSSTGIPLIGCTCPTCTSKSPRNQRLRPSGLIEIGGKRLLIDAGPDFRQQALRASISHLDGLLLTHTHFDHIAGLDDLRVFNFRAQGPLHCLLSEESLVELQTRYHYLFRPVHAESSQPVKFSYQVLKGAAGESSFLDIPIQHMSYWQGEMKVTGYRFGSFAYISDIRTYDELIFSHLKGVRRLVLSALRDGPSRVHLSLDEAVQFATQVGAEQVWLTHVGHECEHETINQRLPSHIQLAYDGLNFEFTP